jgi:hypothetical protein
MNFLSVLYARAGITVDGVTTLNNTATGQTPATNDNSSKLATTGFVKNQNYYPYPTGTTSQYVRGDGSLATFTQTGGGGSSVSYYLNGSVSQGTIGGNTYYEMSKTAVIGTGVDFTINADGYIAQFVTDAGDPALLSIPGGNWNFEMFFSASSGGGSPSFYVELYKYNGTTLTLIASGSANPEGITNGTATDLYITSLAVPTTTLTLTDRLAIRVYVIHSGRTITLHTQDSHLCQIITTFTTGLTALNGLTAQVQNFAVGTGGSDFNISSVTDTHTFNLPTASATKRGALSSIDWSAFDAKVDFGDLSATSPLNYNGSGLFTIAQSSGSTNGYLSSTDWTTFNNKASTAALANYLPLAGGTLTGALNGTSANFGLSVTAIGFVSQGVPNGMEIIGPTGSPAYLITDQSVNNGGKRWRCGQTGAIGGFGSFDFYNQTDNVTALTLASTGAATFSSSVTAQGALFNSSTETRGNIRTTFASDNSYYSLFSNDGALNLDTYGVGGFMNFKILGSTKFTIANSGAATFSSSVTATRFKTSGFVEPTSVVGLFNNTNYGGPAWNNASLVTGNGATGVMMGGDAGLYAYGWIQGVQTDTGGVKGLYLNPLGGAVTVGGAATFSSSVTASSLIKSGGTSSQYLMADGSTSTLTNPVTGTGTTNYLPKFTGASALGNSLVYDNGTNVGIGTTTPAYKLDVSGVIKNNDDIISSNGTISSFMSYSTSSGGAAVLGSISNHDLRLFTNGSTKATITSSGNILIGTTTDSGYKLDVNGTARVSGAATFASSVTANGDIIVNNSTNPYSSTNRGAIFLNGVTNSLYGFGVGGVAKGYLYHEGTNMYFENTVSGGFFNIVQVGAGYIGFQTNGSEKMRLNSSGQLLLGTTTSGSYLLDVNGTGRFSGQLNISNSSAIRLTRFATESTYYGDIAYTSSGLIITSVEGYIKIGKGTGASPTPYLSIIDGGAATFSSSVTAGSFIKSGGTSAQFLKADGSIDSSTYVTSVALAGYLPLTGGTITGDLTVNNKVYVGTHGCYFEEVLIGSTYELRVVDSAGNMTVLS